MREVLLEERSPAAEDECSETKMERHVKALQFCSWAQKT